MEKGFNVRNNIASSLSTRYLMFCSQLLLEKLINATFAHSVKPVLTSHTSEEYGVILRYFEDVYAQTHTVQVRLFSCFRNRSPVWDYYCLCTRISDVKGLQWMTKGTSLERRKLPPKLCCLFLFTFSFLFCCVFKPVSSD